MELIDQHVESLIFTSGQPISEKDIASSLQKAINETISDEEIEASLERLVEKYKSEEYAFEIVPISRGYHFMTKGAYHNTVGEHLKIISKKKLSRAALETLAIIAYKQPVTRIDLEAIRGVGCDYTIQKLMEKELVEMQGRSTGPGRPLLYGTSEKFMDYFGIKDLKDLPKPKDFEMPETEVGEPAPIEVVVPNESTEVTDSESVEEQINVNVENKLNDKGDIQEDSAEGPVTSASEEMAIVEPEEIHSIEQAESRIQKLESTTHEQHTIIESGKLDSDDQVEMLKEERADELENLLNEEKVIVETENNEYQDQIEVIKGEQYEKAEELENLTNQEELLVETERAESLDQVEMESQKAIKDQNGDSEKTSSEEIINSVPTEIESIQVAEVLTDEITAQDQDSAQPEGLIIKSDSLKEEE